MGMYRPRPTINIMYAELPTLFTGLSLPTGLDATTMRELILTELGDLQTICSTAATFAAYLTYWSAAQLPAWTRMSAALAEDYDPLHNYDRTDTETEAVSGSGTESRTGSQSDTRETARSRQQSATVSAADHRAEIDTSSSQFTGRTAGSGSDTTTQERQGFNGGTYVPSDQETMTLGTAQDSASATVGSGQTSADASRSETSSQQQAEGVSDRGNLAKSESVDRTDSQQRSKTLHSAGNIGVTTSQQMLEAEIELRSRWTIYGVILEAFRRALCVGVW